MAKKKNNIQDIEITKEYFKSIGDYSEEAIKISADYIDCHRHMANVADGMKDSYRRLVFSATQFKRGEMIPSTKLVSSVSALHPHSLQGIEDLYANMGREYYVIDNQGNKVPHENVFKTIGEMGSILLDGEGTEMPHAALRYTQGRLSDLYWDIIGDLIKYVPYVDSPVSGKECTYIPLPLPYCTFAHFPVQGLGYGVASMYCNFSPQSLLNAYKNNNPNLLESNFDLILDKKTSELDKLWNTGSGKIYYSYKISKQTINGHQGILWEGETILFSPNFKKLKALEEKGAVYFEPMSDADGQKLFIGKIARDNVITLDDIEKLCRKCCYTPINCQLWVTDGKTCFRIPLKDWINYTYNNYLKLLSDVNLKKIDKVNFDILVQEAIPVISDYIINKNPKATDSEIIKVFGIKQEVVDAVMSKPISYLRKNKDTSDRIKALKDKLKELKRFDPVSYTEEIINKL